MAGAGYDISASNSNSSSATGGQTGAFSVQGGGKTNWLLVVIVGAVALVGIVWIVKRK